MADAPRRIVAWPGISGWLCGTWSQTRYPEDGLVYTRADLIDMDVLRRVEEALDKIARQPRTDEHAEGEGNFEEGYDACVGVARDAIRALKSTTQP